MANKTRSSNIELYRIIMMLTIIAHHLVVNSGVTETFNFNNVTGNMIFLYLFGFGGKPMIDGFLLITGFFMSKGKFTLEKAIKLLLEICFYKIGFYLLFVILGLQTFTWDSFSRTVLYVFYNANSAFPAAFFWLYLLIPFINILLEHLEKRQHQILLAVLLTYFTILSTVFKNIDTFSELGWYITVYMIGGYLRSFEPKILNSFKKNLLFTILSLAACYISILLIVRGHAMGISNISPFYYVSNAHKLLGLLLAICSFQCFRHMKVPSNRLINTLASSIFGVLLIHANSDTMRTLLWRNLLDIKGHYEWKWLPLYSILCVLGIFVVCTVIDQLRIHLLEKPLFLLYHKSRDS